jgi:hypothetical protein
MEIFKRILREENPTFSSIDDAFKDIEEETSTLSDLFISYFDKFLGEYDFVAGKSKLTESDQGDIVRASIEKSVSRINRDIIWLRENVGIAPIDVKVSNIRLLNLAETFLTMARARRNFLDDTTIENAEKTEIETLYQSWQEKIKELDNIIKDLKNDPKNISLHDINESLRIAREQDALFEV